MKLVERLARALLEWPHGVESITQSSVDGELYFHHADYEMTESGIYLEQADYCLDVTRAQWEAERARIASDKPDAEPGSVQRTQYEQELWDKVAIAAFAHEDRYSIGACFDIADAFIAERAKRLKK